MNPLQLKLIHVALIHKYSHGCTYLFLRQVEPYRYIWFCKDQGKEKETKIWGGTIEEAILNAHQAWREKEIRMIHCGFRYTLPERDEVGTNALFHQMVSSYSSPSGTYFDEELGSNCIVQFASIEARNLWKQLEKVSE